MESVIAREAGTLTKDYMASYSRYVAQSRAIPSLVDGLKPVQRRCLTSADDLHIYHSSKFMKTAKLEGQVIGDYHPHGGANVTVLVQPFKTRYPLLEGQGNWGCPDDPNSVAASRYTEVRLTKFAEDFYLSSRKYADHEPNYDGRLQEVKLYYPPIPGALLTGAEGIAIGLTTKVPTHEIGAVCRSLLSFIENPTSEDYLSGLYPDTCEKSILLSDESEIRKLYTSGEASLKYKAVTHYEKSGDYHSLVVDAFPPGFSRKKLENGKILQYVDNGDLTLQNESSTDIRYVFTSKSLEVLSEVESLLESSVSYKMHLEHNGVVSLYSLRMIYEQFLSTRVDYIIRKYTDLSESLIDSLRYSKALIKVKENPDILKTIVDLSDDESVALLVTRLCIDNDVAKKILGTPIRSLLRDNIAKLMTKIEEDERLLLEYEECIKYPVKRIVRDIKDLQSAYGGSQNSLKSTPQVETSRPSYIVVDGSLEVDPTAGDAPLNSKYYLLYDDTGFVVVDGDLFRSKYPTCFLKTDSLRGIVGLEDLQNYNVVYDDAVVKLDTWSLRRRSSKVVCVESKSKKFVGVNHI